MSRDDRARFAALLESLGERRGSLVREVVGFIPDLSTGVVAIGIVGSCCRRLPDEDSDVDLQVVVERSTIDTLLQALENKLRSAPHVLWVIARQNYPWFGTLTSILFEADGHFWLDIGVVERTNARKLGVDPAAIVVLGRHDELYPDITGALPDPIRVRNGIDEIIKALAKLNKHLKRGHLLAADFAVMLLRRGIIALWWVEYGWGQPASWNSKPDRDIEDVAPDLVSTKLAGTLPSYRRDSILMAAVRLINEFDQLKCVDCVPGARALVHDLWVACNEHGPHEI